MCTKHYNIFVVLISAVLLTNTVIAEKVILKNAVGTRIRSDQPWTPERTINGKISYKPDDFDAWSIWPEFYQDHNIAWQTAEDVSIEHADRLIVVLDFYRDHQPGKFKIYYTQSDRSLFCLKPVDPVGKADWTSLKPAKLVSSLDTQWTCNGDIIHAENFKLDRRDFECLILEFEPGEVKNVTGFRIEILTDPRNPQSTPGFEHCQNFMIVENSIYLQRVSNNTTLNPGDPQRKIIEDKIVFCCKKNNDLYTVFTDMGFNCKRYEDPYVAIDDSPAGSGVMILADEYPHKPNLIPPGLYEKARQKQIRLYIEFPESLYNSKAGEIKRISVERGVVTSPFFGDQLKPMRIIKINDCHYVDVDVENPIMVIARVQGFDVAALGLKDSGAKPLLFEDKDKNALICTSKFSQFVTARYTPQKAWETVWQGILGWLVPGISLPQIHWQSTVHPTYSPEAVLPADAESLAIKRGVEWFYNSRMFLDESRLGVYQRQAAARKAEAEMPNPQKPGGDGSLGLLEGFSGNVLYNGSQQVRWLRRSDCMGEVIGLLALANSFFDESRYLQTATNLRDYLYSECVLTKGERSDPDNSAYGLIGWFDWGPTWIGRYYADDNSRNLFGGQIFANINNDYLYNELFAKCLLANLRTSGQLGFRLPAITQKDLDLNGWEFYFRQRNTHISPHYQSYIWANYIQAYSLSGEELFLKRAKMAIEITMDAFPDGWKGTANSTQAERARMLLPLSWLVRMEDTPKHRNWLRTVAEDMLEDQVNCGAVREQIGPEAEWRLKNNKDFGKYESALMYQQGDPVCDLLYTTNYAFLALHEAYKATGEEFYKEAEDKLADFLLRIQVKSTEHPEFDGAWFRGFDYKKWEYWSSDCDPHWGSSSVETGWTQSWITIVFILRQLDLSLWDVSRVPDIGLHIKRILPSMIPDKVIAALSLAYNMKTKASNVFQGQLQYGPDKAVDGNESTRWATDGGTHRAWLEVDLQKPVIFNKAVIKEACPGRIQKFQLEKKVGDTWQTFHTGTTLKENKTITFEPVTARFVRLNILKATQGPTIWEFELFLDEKERSSTNTYEEVND